jgi:hypothetical protein
MCTYKTRVFTCGHYKKTLKTPCQSAKDSKTPCNSGSEDSNTTGSFCYESGCDKEAGGRRDGPGHFPYYDLDFLLELTSK